MSSRWNAFEIGGDTKLDMASIVKQVQLNSIKSYENQLQVIAEKEDELHVHTTFSRWLVKKYLSKMGWYNPLAYSGRSEGTSLRKAWTFFEHYTLARYMLNDDGEKVRALPGEIEQGQKTFLYSVWGTKENELTSWGVGLQLYFNMLRKLSILFLVVGLINTPTIYYFNQSEYSPKDVSGSKDVSNSIYIKGTALCRKHTEIVCENCGALNVTKTNDCKMITRKTVANSWITFIAVISGFTLLSINGSKQAGKADEEKISSSDYSIMVKNPPKDAIDPDEWRDFFSRFDEFSPPLVTIALGNEILLRSLRKMKIFRKQLQVKLQCEADEVEALEAALNAKKRHEPKKQSIWSLIRILLRPLGLFLTEEELLKKIKLIELEIQNLRIQKYNVSKVFVTMETERGQRNALRALDIGSMFRDNSKHNKHIPKFHGVTLDITEAKEPTSVRWLDLSESTLRKVYQKIITWAITSAILAGLYYLIPLVKDKANTTLAAFVVSIANILAPLLLRILTNMEAHASAGARQLSLYLKITIFRWMNTVLIIIFSIPPTSIESFLGDKKNDLIPAITSIFIFEVVFSPILRILDIIGSFNKHIRAPRATSQLDMNSFFVGTPYNLAERYTDMTKMMLFCLFYSAIYPSSFLIGGFALMIQYWTDKFCLLRIWSVGADVGPQVTRMNREVFVKLALVIYVLSTACFWAGFPFDNVCRNDNGVYEFCNQNLFSQPFPSFPPINMIKMNLQWIQSQSLQAGTVRAYGSIAFIFIVLFGIDFLQTQIKRFIIPQFKASYIDKTEDQQERFSTLLKKSDILAYVPQLRIPGYFFPLFACDLSGIMEQPDLIGWQENDLMKYDDFNLVYDYSLSYDIHEDAILDRVADPIFSIVKHWPNDFSKLS